MAVGKPKLGTKTPDADDTNALVDPKVDAHERFIKAFTSPKGTNRHLVIGFVAVDKVELLGGGERAAFYSFRHIELPSGEQLARAEELLLDIYSERTGNTALPGDDSANQIDMTGLDQ